MILRPVSLDDVSALSRLGTESFIAAFGHLYKKADLDAFLEQVYSEKSVEEEIRDDHCVHCLADDGERLLGFVKLRHPSWYEEDSPSDATNPVALGQLYTQPDATGQGIGAALMEWAIAEARQRGHDAIQLSVWSENFGGQRFYQRYGFEKVADIDFYVGEHRDEEFLYELRLA
ncbi:GNAT family N-acetyltransferase [Parerythrobacter jejuensis]|uniref:GNAT family N-acetyltransferase n=1 Tax=Parerythrobacter jejuensis TaxID=795812 RepID=A0A845B2L0_9SPHN|nr:GNAT family N-acetyltransferase [Parerythrobacter jejuensis]MXP30448.1 GNAT family N-acetyltransferase [Parerythrobacter jejuensis]MXP33208.1 GNAT family N-acetyltransferase [Parerythrobacter jejuensis]